MVLIVLQFRHQKIQIIATHEDSENKYFIELNNQPSCQLRCKVNVPFQAYEWNREDETPI